MSTISTDLSDTSRTLDHDLDLPSDDSIGSADVNLSSVDLVLTSTSDTRLVDTHTILKASSAPHLDERVLEATFAAKSLKLAPPSSVTSTASEYPQDSKVINHVASFWFDLPARSAYTEKIESLERQLRATMLSLKQFKHENEAMRRKLRALGHDDKAVSFETETLRHLPTYSDGFNAAPSLFTCFAPDSIYIGSLLDSPKAATPYAPSLEEIHRILSGDMHTSEMDPKDYRAVVWVIANCTPHGSKECNSVKTAVNHLTHELTFHCREPTVDLLTAYIIEHGVKLCKIASGNYLCQVMLEYAAVDDRRDFITTICSDIIDIANHRFGCHVLNKALESDDLQALILKKLEQVGIPASMQTGARRVWRSYTEICRKNKDTSAFNMINKGMAGHWVSTAIANEHGSISCQQVFEVYPNSELMEPCYKEIATSIQKVANNVFGRFVITKLLSLPAFASRTIDAILTSSSPVAISIHGVNFVKSSLADRGRKGVATYIKALCNHDDGESAGLIEVASCSLGPAHLKTVLHLASDQEKALVDSTCREFSTTLRMSQNGNDFLRLLGLFSVAMGPRRQLRRL